jgi:hypothetical protein
MIHPRRARTFVIALAVLLALAAFTIPSFAQSSYTDVFDAGIACEDFAVQVDTTYDHEVYREFFDKDGNLARGLFVSGGELVFTNLSTGETVTVSLNGSVFHDRYNPDGSWAGSFLTGNYMVILFPTDIYANGDVAGPSTKLYSGRFEFTVDENGDWTVTSIKGKSRDICAELS